MSNDRSVEPNAMRNALHILMRISFPYIIIVSIIGICGNFLTIIMLSKKTLSKNFNNCTLIALALTDLLFNFTLVSRGINDLTQSHGEYLCRLLSFLSHLAELLSACFTAQFTAQRFIAVRFPLSVFIEQKIHLIHYFIVSLFIIFGIIYCRALVQNAAYDDCHEELDLKWFISDALLSFLIPFTMIIILNILIVFHLKKGFRNSLQFHLIKRQQHIRSKVLLEDSRKKNSAPDDDTSNMYIDITLRNSKQNAIPVNQPNGGLLVMNESVCSSDFPHRSSSSAHLKSQSYRVTRMLIIVSTCFLLLNAPSHICTIGLKIYALRQTTVVNVPTEIPMQSYESAKQHNQTSSKVFDDVVFVYETTDRNDMTNNLKLMELIYIIAVITQHISYLSYSINFFLYSFCGMKLRRELVKCISIRRNN